ncbi:hypothetical protein ABBQ32_000210 [Trebouxia sp. C0010 RCD-2024]
MKFKGTFSDRGLRALEKSLLPTLEKFGKTCQLLLGPDNLHFIQASQDTDGMQITASWAVSVLFEPETYRTISKKDNLIAFVFEIPLLLRVLKAAGNNAADSLEVKLAMRTLSIGPSTQPVSRPYLTFASKGHNLNMTQDLPVSKPYTAGQIDELNGIKDVTQLCLFYIDLQGEVQRLQAIADKMKGISATLTLTITRPGDLHLQVSGNSVQLGAEVRGLKVVPPNQAMAATPLGANSPEERLQEALQNHDAVTACIQQKHFARSLQSSQLTQPAQLLCGIAESGYVHFMFVYKDPMRDVGYDNDISLSYCLPVRED